MAASAARHGRWVALMLLTACGGSGPEVAAPGPDGGSGSPVQGGWFENVTEMAGVGFHHWNGAGGDKHLPEMTGGSVAVLDQDGDGDFELLFAQGAPLPGCDAGDRDWRDRMFRAEGAWQYVDMTDQVHCDDGAYSLSVSTPDVDGDGDPDLLYANFGRNRLLRNDGDRFVDVTDAAGLDEEEWSSVAAWADLDRDGDLDAYVANYMAYPLTDFKRCGKLERGPEWHSYCDPSEYPGQVDRLYENRGDGRFREVGAAAGLGQADGKALGVTTLDLDQDGLLEVFVANDTTPNFLWQNAGGLRFRNVADEWAVDLAGNGLAQGCMGVDLADVDSDGDFDLFVTNFAMETNTLYRRDRGYFTDRSFPSGLGSPSLPMVGFGTRFLDADNDGDEDLVSVNGHILDNIHLYQKTLSFRLRPQLYLARGDGTFVLVEPQQAGPFFDQPDVGRALAVLDADDDGALDLVVVNNNGQAALLRNRGAPGAWIGVRLRGPAGNPTGIGARLEVRTGERTWRRVQRGASSYNAVSDPRLHVGLGATASVDELTVTWPDGTRTTMESPRPGRYHDIHHSR